MIEVYSEENGVISRSGVLYRIEDFAEAFGGVEVVAQPFEADVDYLPWPLHRSVGVQHEMAAIPEVDGGGRPAAQTKKRQGERDRGGLVQPSSADVIDKKRGEMTGRGIVEDRGVSLQDANPHRRPRSPVDATGLAVQFVEQ